MRKDITEQAVRDAAETFPTIRQAAMSLNLSFQAFKHRALKYGCYRPNPHYMQRLAKGTRKISRERLVDGNHCLKGPYLKRRLIEASLLEDRCVACGIGSHWNGATLVLQLDHVSGVRADNRLDNLRVLCPNCHTQTPTWGAGNRRSR